MRKTFYNWLERIYVCVGILLVIMFMALSIARGHYRSTNNMECIGGNYVYNKETHIVYTEDGLISLKYTVYHDKDGNLIYYIPETHKWVPVN